MGCREWEKRQQKEMRRESRNVSRVTSNVSKHSFTYLVSIQLGIKANKVIGNYILSLFSVPNPISYTSTEIIGEKPGN